MIGRSSAPALHDIIDAIEHVARTLAGITLEEFQEDLDRRRIVERNVEIVSEASRRLPASPITGVAERAVSGFPLAEGGGDRQRPST